VTKEGRDGEDTSSPKTSRMKKEGDSAAEK